MRRLRLGTRGSALALWQAEHVAAALRRAHGVEVEFCAIKTAGDAMPQTPVGRLGRKGVFIKELEEALLEGKIDLAAHSLKDVPTELPAGLILAAVCERASPFDCLVSRAHLPLAELPAGTQVGTSSVRRQAQLRRYRGDLEVAELRGNVDTRLRKLETGLYDAIVLAKAGLDRLGWTGKITEVLPADIMLPAAGQGAVAVEARADDGEVVRALAAIDHEPTRQEVGAERALLREVEGGCQLPVAVLGRVEGGRLRLEACVLSLDGSDCVRDSLEAPASEAEAAGVRLGQKLLRVGAERILKAVVRP